MEIPDLLISPFLPGNAVKATDNGDGTTTLSGLAVIFDTEDSGAHDSEGDFFTKSTFLSTRLARGEEDEFEATWYHGIATRPEYKALASHEFSHPIKATSTDEGLVVSLILEERDQYERSIATAAKAGALGWSIGSASHRAKKTRLSDGRNRIERYPIVEIAATHKPVEPRTFAVPLKALLEDPSEVAVKAIRAYREELAITHALRSARLGLSI